MLQRTLLPIGLLALLLPLGCGGDDATTSPTERKAPPLGDIGDFAELPPSSEGLAFGPGPTATPHSTSAHGTMSSSASLPMPR